MVLAVGSILACRIAAELPEGKPGVRNGGAGVQVDLERRLSTLGDDPDRQT
jgi:hypothetical protein